MVITDEIMRRAQAELAHRALERAPGVTGLLARAGTLLAAGDVAGAVALARAAHGADPHLRDADRLLLMASQPADPAVIHQRAATLAAAGFAPSPIIDHLLRAAALLGRDAEVRRLTSPGLLHFDRLHGADDPDLAPLTAELTDELRHYAAPKHRAIHEGWRRDDLNEGGGPPFIRRMFDRLRGPVERYLASLAPLAAAEPDHLFLAGRPSHYQLGGWSVVSGADTYHSSHIHPTAWANGVYYIEVPPVVGETDRRAGWLHIGPPDGAPEHFEAWEGCWVRPEPGLIVLMPSYFHHRTVPLGVDQRRVCVAFEIYPVGDAKENG